MAILHAISSKILPIILLFTRISTKESEICQSPPLGNCFSKCYEECKTSAVNENDELKLENVVMAKHMCDSKCRSEIVPSKNTDPNDNNVVKCAGVCQQPLPEHCKSGYLAKLFYCDCLSCCQKLGGSNVLSCQDGCYEHFGRLDEDVYTTQVCKFHPDFTYSQHVWCQAWCVWKLHSLNIMPIYDVPMLYDGMVTRCTSRCAGFVEGGAKVDYSTKVPIKCSQETDYWNCVKSVKLARIELESVSDEAISSLPGIGSGFKDKKIFAEGDHHGILDFTIELNYKVKVSIKLSWSPALKFIIDNGGSVTGVDSIELVQDPKPSEKIPWTHIVPLIREAFQKPNPSNAVSSDVPFVLKLNVLIKYCTEFTSEIKATLKKINVPIEFLANVSDSKSMIPLAAKNLTKALEQKPELKGLTYIQDVNDFVVRVKGTMSVDITFPDFSVVFEKCSKRNGCSPHNGWTPNTACKGTLTKK